MIYYLLADHSARSWGTGMIYEHVRLLRASGFDAVVLHYKSGFRPEWLEGDAAIRYLDEPGFTATSEDIVVVPEIMASWQTVQDFPWRRTLFVQGTFMIFRGLGETGHNYRGYGYERAMAVLPHVAHVVERHFGVPADVVPPFVAPYFFSPPASSLSSSSLSSLSLSAPSASPRENRLLFAMKDGYRALGIPDQEIARRLLADEIARRPGWSFVPLEGFTHREVAELMRTSMFLANVHSHEAFNTTVPEAMAAGCVPICYEAVGGQDYLRDGENAIVFQNGHVWELVEKVCELLDTLDAQQDLLAKIRAGGRATAESYSQENTAQALKSFFSALGS